MRKHNKSHRRPDFRVKPQSLDESADNMMRAMEKTCEAMRKSNAMLVEINAKLDAIMEHLGVPPKPPAGFVKE